MFLQSHGKSWDFADICQICASISSIGHLFLCFCQKIDAPSVKFDPSVKIQIIFLSFHFKVFTCDIFCNDELKKTKELIKLMEKSMCLKLTVIQLMFPLLIELRKN